jgi:predicted PurR-regulated permease PerM
MNPTQDRASFRRLLDTGLHLALAAVIVVYCFQVVRPFIQPFVWGGILAIAIHPVYLRLRALMGGRAGLAATVLVAVALLLLIVPSVLIGVNLAKSAAELAHQLEAGTMAVPPPPPLVADLPLVGERLHDLWTTASQNLEAAVLQAGPAVEVAVHWLLAAGANAGVGTAVFALSIAIAGLLLSYSDRVAGVAYSAARRVFEERGDELVGLSRDTVESVTRGILGVALIQATLSGVALLVAGIPGAGLWALLVLLMAVIQLPTILLLGPIVLYVVANESALVSIPFAIWILAVSLSDNVLKPLLLGRGAKVPMLVIFMGAIGGFMLEGIIGLFVGAVALAVGFSLFKEWLEEPPE